ncbi:MAG: D-aminoacyl-tRNA deacylase [Caldilineales bacterium]
MRALVQRVRSASVVVEGQPIAAIGHGMLVLLGITHNDDAAQALILAQKMAGLRIFDDRDGKMNLALSDVGGAVLLVSQFTLYADARRGRRPSFTAAARPEQAEPLCAAVAAALQAAGLPVQTGKFGAAMQVHLVNDGPVTLWLDTADW